MLPRGRLSSGAPLLPPAIICTKNFFGFGGNSVLDAGSNFRGNSGLQWPAASPRGDLRGNMGSLSRSRISAAHLPAAR